MAERKWTDEQKQQALELYLQHGTSEAARQTGIPKGTVAAWVRRAGVETRRPPAQTEVAVETAGMLAEQRRLELADQARVEALHLLDRMRQPTTYHHVKTVGLGEGRSEVEVVEVDLPEPTAADVRNLASAFGTLVEKVQLLTGQATDRHDLTGGYDLEAELRQHQAQQAEAAAIVKAQGVLS